MHSTSALFNSAVINFPVIALLEYIAGKNKAQCIHKLIFTNHLNNFLYLVDEMEVNTCISTFNKINV